MSTMLIAWNATRESGSFMGDQCCALKTAYLFVQNEPNVNKVIVSLSPTNEMHFLLEKFLDDPRGDGSVPKCELVYDTIDPGNWPHRWEMWDRWRSSRVCIEGQKFDHYRELYLRIHGAQRQQLLCGSERGLGRNIYEYWYFGQENMPEEIRDVDEWNNHGVLTKYSFGDDLIYHPPLTGERDVYISPHAKTQGNITFTFDFWSEVVHRLIDAGVTVTVGYNGYFCEDLNGHALYRKYWGDHGQWMEQICRHRLVACGNTGTGWLAAACGVPMVTMEPPNSVMSDHRYRECGLRNIVEVVDTPDAAYVAKRIIDEVHKCVVMTTGCYDVLHAGHIRHLERSRTLGTKLIVALNSDSSIKTLKGHNRPINPQEQRKTVLEALRCVDEVRVFDGPNALSLIKEIKPQVVTNGYGYILENVVGKKEVESWGGRAVITCHYDASDEPSSTTKIVQRVRTADVIEICRIGANASVNPFEKLKLMADHFLSVKDLQGDVADLGACRGGTSLVLRRLAPDKHLHIFDTWEGTPYDDPLCHHKKGEWAVSLEDCKQLVGNGETTYYWQGVFPNNINLQDAPWWDQQVYCFVYVDMDTYQATRDAIALFWPRMVVGGKMVFDDYQWPPCTGVEKAVSERFEGPDKGNDYSCDCVSSLYTLIITKKG